MKAMELRRITEERTQLAGLAALYQRWAEICKERSQKELTPELMWLTRGMAIGHQLDAWRARSLSRPASRAKPPIGELGMVVAFEAILDMAEAMAAREPDPDPEVGKVVSPTSHPDG